MAVGRSSDLRQNNLNLESNGPFIYGNLFMPQQTRLRVSPLKAADGRR
jgi:hypothetical protein